jgi:hypothetical protein
MISLLRKAGVTTITVSIVVDHQNWLVNFTNTTTEFSACATAEAVREQIEKRMRVIRELAYEAGYADGKTKQKRIDAFRGDWEKMVGAWGPR